MTGLGYTVPAVLAVIGAFALEILVLRTGLFHRLSYWLSMVIVLGFQVPVDGWLTKLSSPIVMYNEQQFTGLRFPFDIPIEDFLFGFAMVTVVLLIWDADHRGGRSHVVRNGSPFSRRTAPGPRSRTPGHGWCRTLRRFRR